MRYGEEKFIVSEKDVRGRKPSKKAVVYLFDVALDLLREVEGIGEIRKEDAGMLLSVKIRIYELFSTEVGGNAEIDEEG